MNSTSQIGGHDNSGTVWVFAISIGIILLLVFFLIGYANSSKILQYYVLFL